MKKICLLKVTFAFFRVCFFIMVWNASMHAQNLQWVFKLGASGNQHAFDLAFDTTENIIAAGTFASTCDFDPGTGVANMTAGGSNTAGFVSKYDANKNYQWAKSFSSSGDNTNCNAVGTDQQGNVFVGGDFGGTLDIDPGAATLNVPCAGFRDGFLVKLDASGNYLWGFAIAGAAFFDMIGALAVDVTGNVYITGYFQGAVDFDPGPATTIITSFLNDMFIAKYDASGNFVWARNIGGSNASLTPYDIAMDASGNVLVTGSFDETSDFDPSPSTTNLTTAGDIDIFIAKYDNSGNFIWAKAVGGSDTEEPQAIVTDGNGNVYITGGYYDTVDFDPGNAVVNLTSTGQADIYFASYDSAGNFRWAHSFGSTAPTFDEMGMDMVVTDSNNIYFTGSYRNTIDINPAGAAVNLTSNGQTDMFLARFDDIGNFLTAFSIGGSGLDFPDAIAHGKSGNIYWAGAFNATVDFDPGSGNSSLVATSLDAFVASYGNGFTPVQEVKSQMTLLTYPNPAQSEITVSSNLPFDELCLTDALGRKIIQFKNQFPEAVHRLSVSHLPPGVYFMEVLTETHRYFRPFVKL